MFSQERTELDGTNGFGRTPIVKSAGVDIRLDGDAGTRAAANGAADHLSATVLPAGSARAPLWKRVLDVFCILVALPALLPLSLIIAGLIKLTSKGPVLFKQERVGLLGRTFTVFKFRTMVVGADTAGHETHVASLIETDRPMVKLDGHGDKRLIPVGRVLRASGLDELPQLINVLRGEMSLVGPRPCIPSEYAQYLPWQKERFRALPGLTGLWQVSGKNRLTFSQMMDCDIQYVRTQSLRLDVKIMLKTIPALIAELKDLQGPKQQSVVPPGVKGSTEARWM
jgi:lipopolysaccharide/colanic/teichoic acid biosynthesis glycosyltransferase